jgi:two-component system OmpR family sensor kinase
VLLVVGLGAFGVATYSLYAPTLYSRLDTQLRASVGIACSQLQTYNHVALAKAGVPAHRAGGGGPGGGQPDHPDGPVELPPGSYAVLRTPSRKWLAPIIYGTSTERPKLPSHLERDPDSGQFFTVGSVTGSTMWQVLWADAPDLPDYGIAVAVPTTAVTRGLRTLVLVEGMSAAVLLVVLLLASWVMLRRGLRPLEEIATSSRAIAAGDLSRRVGPEKGATEVVELGSALNVMLAAIEKAFAEREATEARLRQFLADASHELRTPLTSIQGFAELFRIGVHSEHVDDATIIRRIEDEAGRMKRLVEDLLTLARLDETPAMASEPVDLAVIAADACSDAVATAPDRPVSLDAPAPVVVLGDRNHLQQAMANLVSNAIRHTPAKSAVEVACRRDGAEGVLSVRDHGTGLDTDALAKSFERFWQADQSRAGSGAGLGLAIVSAIAAEHGGRAEAANAPGGGAIFTIRLPIPPEPAVEGVPRARSHSRRSGTTAFH